MSTSPAPGKPDVPIARIEWPQAVRIIRSIFPPIDLFEDVADPADWALLISVEQKTNPRLMESIGTLDLVPAERRVGGSGATLLMAPFTHVSTERPSRFSDGRYGVLYAGDVFETALMETVHHHRLFMLATAQEPGWTSHFREIVLSVSGELDDIRGSGHEALLEEDYAAPQAFGAAARARNSNGIVYPSVRNVGRDCVGLFYPDLASNPVQSRHLDYHWDGERVDYYRIAGSDGRDVFRIE